MTSQELLDEVNSKYIPYNEGSVQVILAFGKSDYHYSHPSREVTCHVKEFQRGLRAQFPMRFDQIAGAYKQYAVANSERIITNLIRRYTGDK